MSFRLNAKNLYLTYPKCPLEKSVVLEQLSIILTRVSKTLEHYAIAQEKHKDDSLHLHVILWINSKVNFKNANFADLNGESTVYHGNYQGLKLEKQCVTYVMKEDQDILTDDLDRLKTIIEGKKRKLDSIAQSLMEGTSLRELTKDHAGCIMINFQKMKQFQEWFVMGEWKREPLPMINGNMSSEESKIGYWIATNLWETKRPLRTKNLYIWGLGCLGKSTLISILEKSFITYKPSPEVKWWDKYTDECELIVFDEFSAQWKINEMNKYLDGQSMTIPRRNGDYYKQKNVPVIICSNYDPDTLYQGVNSVVFQAWKSRLTIINVTSFINVFNQ